MKNKILNDVSVGNWNGFICNSKESGKFEVVEYINTKNITVKFYNTGSLKCTNMSNIRKGLVRDNLRTLDLGVGVVGTKYPATVNGKTKKEYQIWYSMLDRCYNKKTTSKNVTYKDCNVSENFTYYEYFHEWCNEQIGFISNDYHIDKDLLVKGNKIYSENTCVFLPREINNALPKCDKARGNCLIGVRYKKSVCKYEANCSFGKGKSRYLGSFNTEIEAFNAYKHAKENHLKELANKWKDKIDHRAYNALMNYEVTVND